MKMADESANADQYTGQIHRSRTFQAGPPGGVAYGIQPTQLKYYFLKIIINIYYIQILSI